MSTNNALALKAETLPLQGRHLIEASAGTGKTYNITRIYLRMLLENKLNVQQILVMTFTKAATEEIRGRIDLELRDALLKIDQWGNADSEPFFQHLAQVTDPQSAKVTLRNALLHLDEAAIFTIHGFCKRVLTQQAFNSGIAFNMQMEVSSQDIQLDAIRDWYRLLAEQPQQFELISNQWATPEDFQRTFGRALSSDAKITCQTADSLVETFSTLCENAKRELSAGSAIIEEALILSKKGTDREYREYELKQLQDWLELADSSQPMPASFIAKNRYSRNKSKAELMAAFASCHELHALCKGLAEKKAKAQAMELVLVGLEQIRVTFDKQKLQQRIMDFDDLIKTLAVALANDNEQQLAKALFALYPAALVDEFQDTDPQQFDILRHIYFEQDSAALYMIGDPKQAIYAFRGGDVFAYLDARHDVDQQWHMGTNWRSSAAMINAYNRLFYGTDLTEAEGQDVFGYDIPYLPVAASPKANDERFTDPNNSAALMMADFALDEAYKHGNSKVQKANSTAFRLVIARWCAGEIARLLNETDINGEPIQHQDVAILVRDGKEAAYIKDALNELKLASVYLSNRENLLRSDEADELQRLLAGILHAEDDRKFVAALSTRFFGFDSQRLYTLQQDEMLWEQQRMLLIDLREMWMQRGFMNMALKVLQQDVWLSPDSYERALTNIIHLFELLQGASQRHRAPQELYFWFQQQRQLDSAQAEAELRLESDANLIRIVTLHGSKGLEYPIVFVPFVTRHKDPAGTGFTKSVFMSYHDDNRQLNAVIGDDDNAKQRMCAESYAESIRLLYVAVTRAVHRCYLCTTAFDKAHLSPLGLTLKLSADDDVSASIQQFSDSLENDIGYELIEPTASAPSSYGFELDEANIQTETLAPAPFSGRIERDWWLSSFSALSRNIRHGGKSNPDRDIESEDPAITADSSQLRFELAKGAHAGNLLHDILEHTDFSQPNWTTSVKYPLTKFGALTAGYTEQDLIDWLQETLETQLAPTLRLADLSWEQTLRETEFYFPMQQAHSSKLSQLLIRHRKDHGSTTLQHGALPHYSRLSGMMHGFIDLVFEHQGKYFICDYKSTHLGDRYSDYLSDSLSKNIEQNYYDLQYLIYSLALHRHLRERIEDYNPEHHFGGVYYLYLRGMSPANESSDNGVFYRPINAEELDGLDAIFANDQHQDDATKRGAEHV